jgi:hypothetical protein
MRRVFWVVLVLFGLPLLGLLPAVASTSLGLPAGFADYRTWAPLTKEPQAVPLALWLQCAAATRDQRAAAYKEHGPHAERYIRVYANPSALQPLRSTLARTFPTGAVIAKEKIAQAGDADASGVAFMVKRDGRAFSETGGWEFSYYPSVGDVRQTHEACAACHRTAASNGYVLGNYGEARKLQP